MSGVSLYVWNVLIAIDQLGNALTGGYADETISSRIGKSIRDGGWASKVPWPKPLYDHFMDSIEDDEFWPG